MTILFLARTSTIALAILTTPMVAQADTPTFGSGAILTNRLCTNAPGADCAIGRRNFLQFAGGAGSAFTTSATNEAGTGAAGMASSSFGVNALPTLGVGSFSGARTRTGASAVAYQTFTYSGAKAINLVLAGTLHFFGSGDLIAAGMPGFEPAGQAFFGVNIAIVSPSMLADFGTTAQELISSPTAFADCGSGAIAHTFASSAGTGAGEHSLAVSLNTVCNGGAITINPGESFASVFTLQAITNQGGSLDGTHTFSATFDPVNTVFTDTGAAVGSQFLALSISAVPELGTWATMLIGFGLIGLCLRRVGSVIGTNATSAQS